MESVYWGVSTSMLEDKYDWEALLAFEPKVIEFYNYKSFDINNIQNFCSKHSIIPALHVPTPYDGEILKIFSPTGSDVEQKKIAIKLTQETIKCANGLQALHVVVHFPSPFFPTEKVSKEDIEFFFDPVMECAEKYNVRILVENLSAHELFYSPHDYLEIVKKYDNLGICLDLGHAHLLSPQYTTEDFIHVLKEHIFSAHIYDTCLEGPRKGRHFVLNNSKLENGKWINISECVKELRTQSSIKAFILEYDALSKNDLKQAAEDWSTIKLEYQL